MKYLRRKNLIQSITKDNIIRHDDIKIDLRNHRMRKRKFPPRYNLHVDEDEIVQKHRLWQTEGSTCWVFYFRIFVLLSTNFLLCTKCFSPSGKLFGSYLISLFDWTEQEDVCD